MILVFMAGTLKQIAYDSTVDRSRRSSNVRLWASDALSGNYLHAGFLEAFR
jgi:hypothetical protein